MRDELITKTNTRVNTVEYLVKANYATFDDLNQLEEKIKRVELENDERHETNYKRFVANDDSI